MRITANSINTVYQLLRQGKFVSEFNGYLKSILPRLKYILHDPAGSLITLHCPDYIVPSHEKEEQDIVERIFQSFIRMKADQKTVTEIYRPSSMWQKHLDESYSNLSESLDKNKIDKFHFFLTNFGTWKEYHGIESTTLIHENMKSRTGRLYLKNDVFYHQLQIWRWFYNNRKPIADLTYPMHGNQSGAYIDKNFVGVGSFFNEIYSSILSGLIEDTERPIIAELGAGYGKLAYFILRNQSDACFIDFDLPETLCLAAYYLMKSFPEKKFLLYGEEPYMSGLHHRYDVIFMPSYEIEKVGQNCIDLFINKNSLGEMSKEAVLNYVYYIAKSTNYFFHMNHDIHPNIYENNRKGLLGYQYPVPMDKFKLLFRYPDVGHMLYLGGMDYEMDIFAYLYQRKLDRS